MVVYSCHCLNIQLFAEPPSHYWDTQNLESCPLGSDIELVELIDQGFQCSQKCLVHRDKNGSWMTYVCVLCKTATHAVHQDENIVAVSTNMNKGKSIIETMQEKKEFSSAFGLLLSQDEEKDNKVEISGQTYETMQKQLMELQSVLSGFLRKEEDAMERRIRKYEEEQRAKFDTLKENCIKEKTRLTSLLFNSMREQTLKKACDDKPVLDNNAVKMRKAHGPLSQTRNSGVSETTPEKRHSRPLSSSSGRKSRESRDLSPDGDVFAMDDFDAVLDQENDNCPSPRLTNSPRQSRPISGQGFSTLEQRLRHEQQQDRNNSNVSSNGNSSSRSRSRGKDNGPLIEGATNISATGSQYRNNSSSILSSSLPISMPMAPRNARNSSNWEDDIDEESTEFDDIPRHMQALSESIQERDRYIFGDRPRQRVNTGDFTQINWR